MNDEEKQEYEYKISRLKSKLETSNLAMTELKDTVITLRKKLNEQKICSKCGCPCV